MIAVAAYAAQHKRALFHGLTPTATCCRGYAALREHWRKWPFLGRGIPTWLHRSPQVPRKERNKIQTSALQLPKTRNVESATILIIYPPGHQPGDSVGAAKAVAACSRGRQPMERGGDVGELSRERGGSKQPQTKLERKARTSSAKTPHESASLTAANAATTLSRGREPMGNVSSLRHGKFVGGGFLVIPDQEEVAAEGRGVPGDSL